MHYDVESGAAKIKSCSYNGTTVESLDLVETYTSINKHCSSPMVDRFGRWLCNLGVFPDLSKTAAFECLLFISKHTPQSGSEMGENQELWDKAASDLMEEVTFGYQYRTRQWCWEQGLSEGGVFSSSSKK